MNPWLLKFLPYILALLALIALVWVAHHTGFRAGQSERQAYYAPLLKNLEQISAANTARMVALERAATTISAEVEKTHAEKEQVLEGRAAAAEQRYRSLLSHAAAPSCPGQVSGASPLAPLPGPAPEVQERIDRFSRRASGITHGCESDASLAESVQSFYEAQRALQAQ